MNQTHLIESADITGAILKHMIHCEDLALKGERAFHFGLDALQEELKRLNGQESNFKVTAKWDGAPAVVAASDYYGAKFVALKHSWDKGKVYHSVQEIEDNYKDNRPELSAKLTALFTKLDQIKIPKNEIWMGDYLFAHEDLRVVEIDGEDCLTFRPNTLVYAVPNDNSEFVQSIRNAEIGIVWHTKYVGTDFQNLQISFNVNVDELNKVDNIFQIDGRLQKVPVSLFTEEEYERLTEMLDDIEDRFNDITENYKEAYEALISDDKLCQILDRYRNILIRQGSESATYDGLIQHIENIAQADIESKKSERGKANATDKWNKLKNAIDSDLLEKIYELQGWMVVVKEALISKENSLQTIKSYVETRDAGIIPASGEGYAISDANGNIQKFVSRLGFSAANFSDNVIKGWEKLPKTTESMEKTWNVWERILEAQKEKLSKEEVTQQLDALIQQAKLYAASTEDPEHPSYMEELQGPVDGYTDGYVNYAMSVPVPSAESHYRRTCAYQKIIEFLNYLNQKNPNLHYESRWTLKDGTNNDRLEISCNNQKIGSIRLRHGSKRAGAVRKIDATTLLKKGRGFAPRYQDKWMVFDFSQTTRNPGELFAATVLDGAYAIYCNEKDPQTYNPDAWKLYLYFFRDLPLQYPDDIPVTGWAPEIYNLLAKDTVFNATSALTELFNVFLVLSGVKVGGKSTLPDNDEFKGLRPVVLKWPTGASEKFIDSVIECVDPQDPTRVQVLNISSKDGTNGTSGEPAITCLLSQIPQIAPGYLEQFPENTLTRFNYIVSQGPEVFKRLKSQYQQPLNCFWREAAMSYWLYGAELCGIVRPDETQQFEELLCHYVMFYNIYRANANDNYQLQPVNPDSGLLEYKAQDFMPKGSIYEEYQT